jgi:hypothetical protein
MESTVISTGARSAGFTVPAFQDEIDRLKAVSILRSALSLIRFVNRELSS